jgi:hypothetical protein
MSGSFKKGVSKVVAIAKETTFGTLSAATAQQLRRVNFTMNLNKDAYQSQEILPSQQVRDGRHGVRRVSASLNGQWSPGSYVPFFENMLRKPFATGATASSLSITPDGTGGTFTRASGSWIADGFKIGDVVRFSGFTAGGVNNNARNFRIKALTALVMTVYNVAPETVTTVAQQTSITCAVVGKKTMVPVSGHEFMSHSIEEWMPDGATATSSRGLGMTMQAARINLPATGFATVDFQMVGQDMAFSATQAYPAATAPNSANSLAAVNGKIRFNGEDVAYITGAQLQIAAPVDAPPVIGSNIVPAVFAGVISVSGQLNALLRDNTLLTLFDQETEVDVHLYLTTGSTANADFCTIILNRVKMMSNQRNDSDRSIMQMLSFQAYEHVTGAGSGTAYDASTIILQDSLA